MFVNSFQINIDTIFTGVTASTINIPINMEFQIVDNAELINRVFVDIEVEKAINPILDYEKVRFLPKKINDVIIPDVIYNLSFLSGGIIDTNTKYSTIGFLDTDITNEKNNFKYSYVYLRFFDSDNPLVHNLISDVTIYSMLRDPEDYLPNGRPKPATQIPVRFTLNNPILKPRGFSEGYHLYNYKDEYISGDLPKSLYMRASYNNAKTGKPVNLMTVGTPLPIDQLVNKLYTKYDLYRDNTGYYYQVDDSYSTNVTYNPTNITIDLFEIQAL